MLLAKSSGDLNALRPNKTLRCPCAYLFLTEGITDQDLDSFVDMYREHCEVGILF